MSAVSSFTEPRAGSGGGRSVLFINQHYWPDVASTGQHLTDLAEYLASEDFCITVLTGRGGYRGDQLQVEEQECRRSVEIHRMHVPGFGRVRDSQIGRATNYAVFHARTLARLPALASAHELVISLTTPSLLPTTVRLCQGLQGRIPYAVWAMDLHPEVERALGIFPRRRLYTGALSALSRYGYRGAECVVTLGPYMARTIQESKGIDSRRVHQIPVWNDGDEVSPIPAGENTLREALGYRPNDFVVMYSGNAGLAHRFDVVLEAANCLRYESNVHFLFVGGGPRREEIEAAAETRNLPRFRYLDYFPRGELARSLSVGDVHLLTLRKDMAGLCAPGKLYGIMAAGRPTLMVGPRESDPGHVISKDVVGSVIEPGASTSAAARELANHVLRLRDDDEARFTMGEKARAVFLEKYEREIACRQWADLLREMIH